MLALAGGGAFAAGGHHAVDDANMADAGACKVEGWVTRNDGGDGLLHVDAGCGLGPVELTVGGERARAGGTSDTSWQAQVKWAMPVADRLSVGLEVLPAWSSHAYQGTSAVGLFTWAALDQLSLHVNLGRDFNRGAPGTPHYGAAMEWFAVKGWSFVAERYAQQDGHFARAGARHQFGDNFIVDFSRAQRLAGAGVSTWTVGATWLFSAR